MKKTLLLSAIVLATITLTGCATSKSAKEIYIDDFVSQNSDLKSNNVREINIKVNSFNVKGDASSEQINSLLNNASFSIKTTTDFTNKLVYVETKTKLSNQTTPVNLILGKQGLYLERSQLNSLLKLAQDSNPYASLYGETFNKISPKYFLIDSEMMDNGLAAQGETKETWEDIYKESFESKSLNKKDAEKIMKDIPEKDFTQSGDQVKMVLAGDGEQIKTYLKQGVTSSNQSQLQPFIENLDKNTIFKSMKIETTLNTKTNKSESKISGEIQSKDGKTSAQMKVTMDSKIGKSTTSITEPSQKDTISATQVMSDLMAEVS